MENQHKKIKGYRDLVQEEIDLMNAIKAQGEEFYALIQKMEHMEGQPSEAPDGSTKPNSRWLNEGKIDIQKGLMSLVRSVAKPTSF